MAEPETLDFTANVVAVSRISSTNSGIEMEKVELAFAETLDSGTLNPTLSIETANGEAVDSCKKARQVLPEKEPEPEKCFRAEIDTSAPFESVKEAANRFGGIGFWRPQNSNKFSEVERGIEELCATKMEEQAAKLEKDLVAKEVETLNVLKELEATKLVIEELRSKLQKQAFNLNVVEEEKENRETNLEARFSVCPSSAPGLILLQLKQAKLNLNRTTSDLSDIRASIESYTKKIEEERIDVEKSQKTLSSNSSKISALQEELNQTRKKIQLVKDANNNRHKFKKMGEEATSELLQSMSEIEKTNSQIKTAQIRLVAANKIKEAALAAEAIALAEIKALSNRGNLQIDKDDVVTLSMEEYSSLTSKACKADELSKKKVIDAMDLVDEANISKMDILKKVEEATEEVRASKKALQEALNRVEIVNREKLCAEDALRKRRRLEHNHRRHSVHNSSKFKNFCQKDGLNPAQNNEPVPVLGSTLSIGQILSRKLLKLEGVDVDTEMEQEIISASDNKLSLGQMLGKENTEVPVVKNVEKENWYNKQQVHTKRKKFGFVAPFSLLLTKRRKKKKINSIYRSCSSGL